MSEALVHQLQNARKELERLRNLHAPPVDPVLELVVHTLAEARRLAHPAVGSTPTDGDGARGKPGSRPPSGRDRRLARAETALRRRLEDACKGFETALEKIDGDSDPRRPSTEAPRGREWSWPKVWCKSSKCPDYDKGVPSVAVDDAGIVPIWFCPSCGNQYSRHPVPMTDGDKT